MNTCKTCKYWSDRYKIDKGVSDCGFIDTISATKDRKTYVDIEATAHDDSGLQVALMTGEDFGCVHHKGKTSN